MVVLVQATVLTVGLNGKNEVLRELPIQLVTMRNAAEAARSLKNSCEIDSVISAWNLEDMADGEFLKKLRTVKPGIPTIAFVDAGDMQQEIEARTLGVSAILTQNAGDGLFKETLANILGLRELIAVKEISPARSKRIVPGKKR